VPEPNQHPLPDQNPAAEQFVQTLSSLAESGRPAHVAIGDPALGRAVLEGLAASGHDIQVQPPDMAAEAARRRKLNLALGAAVMGTAVASASEFLPGNLKFAGMAAGAGLAGWGTKTLMKKR
jgi:hypothetical protein